MLYKKVMPTKRSRTHPILVSDISSLKDESPNHAFTYDLKVFLRRACTALLVDDVRASKHDLYSDNDRNVLAHLGSRRCND